MFLSMDLSKLWLYNRGNISIGYIYTYKHRLSPIDTHLALYNMLYNNSAKKNRYAEPVLNKTKQISKISDKYVHSFRIKEKDM